MKIQAEQIYKMQRKANREAELLTGRINYKRVFKSKKSYNRQTSKKVNQD